MGLRLRLCALVGATHVLMAKVAPREKFFSGRRPGEGVCTEPGWLYYRPHKTFGIFPDLTYRKVLCHLATMTAHRLKPSRCPECERKLNAASGLDDDTPPSPGAVSVCWYCGTLLEFGKKGKLRRLSDDSLLSMNDSNRILLLRAQRQILALRAQRR